MKIGFLGYHLKDKAATIYPKYKDVHFSATNLDDIGKAVAQALSPAIAPKTANQIIRIHSLRTSQSEILAALEEAAGEKFKVTEVDLDAEILKAKEKMQKGEADFGAMATLLIAAALDARTGNDFEQGGRLNNDLLELPVLEVQSAVKPLI